MLTRQIRLNERVKSASVIFLLGIVLNSLALANEFKTIYEPSGAVVLPDGKLLLVEDESKRTLQLIEISKEGNIKELGTPKMSQIIKRSLKQKVNDVEGVTTDGKRQVYLMTSHSTNKKHKHKKAREQIVRLTYKNGRFSHFQHYHGLLKALKKLHPKLNSSSHKHKKEVNIEALAWEKSSKFLLLGLRSPLIKGKAVVIPLKNPNAIFDKSEEAKLIQPILLDLEGKGIRAMSWDEEKQGYWIVGGSVGKRKGSFSLWFWDKKKSHLSIAYKDVDIGYAEGVTSVKGMGLFLVQDNGSVTTHGGGYLFIK